MVARAPEDERHGLGSLGDMNIGTPGGQTVPLASLATLQPVFEEPVLIRRDRAPTLTVRADVAPGVQPPDVTAAILSSLQPVIGALPEGYAITTGGSVEESAKATDALLPVFPIMIVLMLAAIMLQTRSFLMGMVFTTAPLGLIGAIPAFW